MYLHWIQRNILRLENQFKVYEYKNSNFIPMDFIFKIVY